MPANKRLSKNLLDVRPMGRPQLKQYDSVYQHPDIWYGLEHNDDGNYYGGHDQGNVGDYLWAQALIQKYSPINVNKVLEVCCGACPHGLLFAEHGYQVTGFDYSVPMLQMARVMAEQAGVYVKLYRRDSENFTLSGGPFDMAMCLSETQPAGFTANDGFEYNDAWVRHLDCMARVLKPGALYLLDWGYYLKDDRVRIYEPAEWSIEKVRIPGLATVIRREWSPPDDLYGNVHWNVLDLYVVYDDGGTLRTRDLVMEPLNFSLPHQELLCRMSGKFKLLAAHTEGSFKRKSGDLRMPVWLVMMRI